MQRAITKGDAKNEHQNDDAFNGQRRRGSTVKLGASKQEYGNSDNHRGKRPCRGQDLLETEANDSRRESKTGEICSPKEPTQYIQGNGREGECDRGVEPSKPFARIAGRTLGCVGHVLT